jgi:hypothetical protein
MRFPIVTHITGFKRPVRLRNQTVLQTQSVDDKLSYYSTSYTVATPILSWHHSFDLHRKAIFLNKIAPALRRGRDTRHSPENKHTDRWTRRLRSRPSWQVA